MLHATIEQYCKSLKEDGVYSRATVTNYVCTVRRLKQGFAPTDSMEAVTPASVRKWVAEYRSQHSANTLRQTLTCLHQFFKWCVREGHLLADPSENIPLPKRTAPHHDKFSDAQVKSLLAACERLADPFKCARAKAVYSILTYAGLRRMEVINLKVEDIDLSDRRVEVRHGKGDKARTLYIPPECASAVRSWLKIRPKTSNHRYLFCADNTRRMYLGTLRALLKEIHAIAGVPLPNRPCHTARHSFAQRLRRNRADLEEIADTLGHADISTTTIYLGERSEENKKRMANLASLDTAPPAPTISRQMERQMERKRRRIGL
jgi:integrase/recombinase XerD